MPAALEDGRIPGFSTALLYGTSGLLFAALIWLSLAQVRERVTAPGTLMPSASVQPLQHLEGGIVQEVLVEEGQIVGAGEVLIRLAPTAPTSDLGQLEVRKAALDLELTRIDAALSGEEPDFGELGRRFPELALNQRRLFDRETKHRALITETLTARIARHTAELESLEREQTAQAGRLQSMEEQVTIRKNLMDEGFSSRREYLSAKASADQARVDLVQVTGRIATTKEALSEAQVELSEVQAKEDRTLSEQRVTALGEAAEISESIAKQEDRVTRLELRAPADGIVQDLSVRTPGEVVRAGDIVARLVPTVGDIVAEVRVRPQDVAQISVGHEAEVTVTAFDPNVYGLVKGKVELISASTFQTDEGESYYKALIQFAAQEVAKKSQSGKLLPGMVVDASIITGSKSVMRYVLKPVFRSLDRAFSER